MANKLTIDDSFFGVLQPYIKDDNITDINWNGMDLWIEDLEKGVYKADVKLDNVFVGSFTNKIANLMSETFNLYSPILEAETDSLRISIVHEGVTATGKSISIRKTPAKRRLSERKIAEDKYCPDDISMFLQNAVKAHCNIVISGLPSAGKTELLKFLTQYIPEHERAITIEDNLEIRYREINPGKDCVCFKVNDNFSYTDAIKCSLRQKPVWILLSEARSVEVKSLLESMSTGAHCITTVHTDDVRKIPQRIQNMMPTGESADKVSADIYSFIDVGVQIRSNKTVNGKIERFIHQVAVYSLDEQTGERKTTIVYERKTSRCHDLPADIARKFTYANISNPFERGVQNGSNIIKPKQKAKAPRVV